MSYIAQLETRVREIENLLNGMLRQWGRFGLESVSLYYGLYRATVARNDDPEQRGRVMVWSEDLGHAPSAYPVVWVDPVFPCAGPDRGAFFPPEVGDPVSILCSVGNSGKPIRYFPGWFSVEGDAPAEFAYTDERPQTRGFVSRAGHTVLIRDEPGNEEVSISWHKPAEGDESLTEPSVSANRAEGLTSRLRFAPDGSIEILGPQGDRVLLDHAARRILIEDVQNEHSIELNEDGVRVMERSGCTVTMAGKTLTMEAPDEILLKSKVVDLSGSSEVILGKGADDKVLRAGDFLSHYENHTHGTGVGPSSPPVAPVPPTVKSRIVGTK